MVCRTPGNKVFAQTFANLLPEVEARGAKIWREAVTERLLQSRQISSRISLQFFRGLAGTESCSPGKKVLKERLLRCAQEVETEE